MSNIETNALTREAIYTAFGILLKEKTFAQISITDITTKAGVSRMAYYRNYHTKEEILTNHLDVLFMNYYTEINRLKSKNIYDFSLHFFTYFEKNHELVDMFIRAGLTNELLVRFTTYLEEIALGLLKKANITQEDRYETHFLVGGLWNVLLHWIQDGLPLSKENMATVIDQLGLAILT